jgi:hypothetical protein
MSLNRAALAALQAFFANGPTCTLAIYDGLERRIFVGPGGGVLITEEMNVAGVNYREDQFITAAQRIATPGLVATTVASLHADMLAAIAAVTP